MQCRDDLRGVLEGPDLIERDVPWRPDGPACERHPAWSHDLRSATRIRALQPGQKFAWVSNRRGQTDPLDRSPGEPLQPFEYGEQVPAAIVAREGMHFVDDDGAHVPEVLPRGHLRRHQHRFERLRRR